MEILHNQPLASHVTMHLGGTASDMIVVQSEKELTEAVRYAQKSKKKTMVLGSGSNIIFGDNGYSGVVIINEINGVSIDSTSGLAIAKSGTDWDDFVRETVDNGLSGIEALSLIPGTVGAAPVNNIGAYGQEVKDTITKVRVLDTDTLEFISLSNADCHFKYRDSIFKSEKYGKYIITEVHFALVPASKGYTAPTYASVQTELDKQAIIHPTAQIVRDIIIRIRQSKLPDPKVLPNTGSFFKNPVVSQQKCDELLQKYPAMPYFKTENGIKLAAGWLIDTAGLKGYSKDGIRIYDKQALVLVNDGTTSFTALLNMKNYIQKSIENRFGITLEPEPEIIV